MEEVKTDKGVENSFNNEINVEMKENNGINETKKEDIKEEKENTSIQISDEFVTKINEQMQKLLKELTLLENTGKKITLTDDEVMAIVLEIKEQSNIAKKIFHVNNEKKEDSYHGLTNNMNRVIREFKNLSDLSQKFSGEYSEEHIEKIFSALKKKTSSIKKNLTTKEKKEDTFSL